MVAVDGDDDDDGDDDGDVAFDDGPCLLIRDDGTAVERSKWPTNACTIPRWASRGFRLEGAMVSISPRRVVDDDDDDCHGQSWISRYAFLFFLEGGSFGGETTH